MLELVARLPFPQKNSRAYDLVDKVKYTLRSTCVTLFSEPSVHMCCLILVQQNFPKSPQSSNLHFTVTTVKDCELQTMDS